MLIKGKKKILVNIFILAFSNTDMKYFANIGVSLEIAKPAKTESQVTGKKSV